MKSLWVGDIVICETGIVVPILSLPQKTIDKLTALVRHTSS